MILCAAPSGRALVALGTNEAVGALAGADLLRAAIREMATRGLTLVKASGFWKSPAWPPSAQPDFVNAVVEVDIGGLDPQGVYAVLADIETAFGRRRAERWAQRSLDLDLIDANGVALETEGPPGLILPHPRAHERAFVLAPLAEVRPGWRHPRLGQPVEALLARLGDWPGLVRLCGPDGANDDAISAGP